MTDTIDDPDPTIDALARQAALRYLRSAVVVDDRPFRPLPRPEGLASPDAEVLLAPVVKATVDQSSDAVDGNAPSANAEAGAPNGETDLDEDLIVKAFADLGIACAVLVPPVLTPGRSQAVLRADIVILDWRLGPDDIGRTALALIGAAAEPDPPSARRLVCVYTSDPDLDGIVEKIATRLETQVSGGERTIDSGTIRVHVVSKEVAGSGVPEGELPEKLIEDFVATFRGLVPSIAVNALSAVRDNFPRVLMRLGSELDPGYVGHCLMLAQPADGVDHMRALLGDELRSLIDSDELTSAVAGTVGLQAWVRAAEQSGDLVSAEDATTEHLGGGARIEGHGKKSLTRMVTGNDAGREAQANKLFAHRMTFRTDEWGKTPRVLEPGILLKTGEEASERFFVCVQPACDAVHIKDPTAQFPFLPCEVVDLKPWDYVAATGEGHIRLKLRNRFDSVTQLRFRVDPQLGAVRLGDLLEEAANPLTGVGGGRLFRPVGLLRPDHAKRLCQNVGTQFGRLGIDESEWQRLHLA